MLCLVSSYSAPMFPRQAIKYFMPAKIAKVNGQQTTDNGFFELWNSGILRSFDWERGREREFLYIKFYNHCRTILRNKSSELKVSASTTKIFSQRQNMFLTNQLGFKESVFCKPFSDQRKISIPLYLSLSGIS